MRINLARLVLAIVTSSMLTIYGCGGGGGGGGGAAAAGGSGAQATLKAMTSFSLAGMSGAIDESNKTIALTLPAGSDLTAVIPTFVTTGASVKVGTSTQTSGVTANDFTNPVVYTVAAADGSTANYTVTVAPISTAGVVSQIKSIHASSTAYHVFVIKNDNTVWSWGANDGCQLGPQISCATNGLGAVITNLMTTPTQVAALGTNFAFMTPGRGQSFAFGPSVYTYAWGANLYGVLGDGTMTFRPSPVSTTPGGYKSLASTRLFTAAVRADGTLWAWGSMLYKAPLSPYSANNIGSGFDSVSGGDQHVVALKTDGSVWTWGYSNAQGQLGRTVLPAATTSGTDAETPVQILTGVSRVWAGGRTGYALKTDGTFWAWGDNSSGQLGDGTTTQRTTPIQVQSGFANIAAGWSHVAALKSDGSLWTWGDNSYGQLADGTTTNSLVPKMVGTGYAIVAAEGSSTLAANAVGEIFGAGRNLWGELGNGSQVDSTTLTKSRSLTSSGSGSGTGGVGTAVGGYQCPTTKPVNDPLWIQSHGSYWAAASAHDSYTACLQSNSESTCHSYYTLETQYCSYALPACLTVATSADCPG